MKTTLQVPIDYIDNLASSKHILLLYEDLEHAKMIMFRFIKNGLTNGEECLYATEEDSGSIVVKMLTYGIQLKYFQSKQLHVLQLENRSGSKDEILKICKIDIAIIQNNLKPPFRIVSRIVPNVDTIERISVELDMEREVQCKFDDNRGSIMCPYDISKIEPTKRKQWLENLRENHHAVIYVPKSSSGEVFTLE